MILFTCGQGGNRLDPYCGKARKALDDAGFDYEIRKVPGYRLLPWTWSKRRDGRKEVEALTGAFEVPVLVLDDGIPIAGSRQIVDWVHERMAN